MDRRLGIVFVLVALTAIGIVGAVLAAEDSTRFAFVARGDNPIDALAAAPVAGRLDAPVLLTPPDELSDAAAQGLQDADPHVVVIAGGDVAVSVDVEEEIGALLGRDVDVRRVSGRDRYLTAEALAALIREYDPAFALAGTDTNAFGVGCPDGQALQAITAAGSADCADVASAPATTTRTAVCSPVELAFSDVDTETDPSVAPKGWELRPENEQNPDRVYAESVGPGGQGACDLDIPPGADLQSLTMHAVDNSPTGYVNCSLWALDPSDLTPEGAATTVLGDVQTTSDGSTLDGLVSLQTAVDARVGERQRVTLVCFAGGSGQRFLGAEVGYGVTAVPGAHG